ncbi:MAG: triphosphoribosyl-dephospho-CoA synthase [Promethearchaeota archaeon]
MRCVNLASLLELSGWPKPGNIHRTRNFKDTRFEHFLAGIAAIQPNFKEFCNNVYKDSKKIDEKYSYVKLGLFFREAAKEMMKWQKGGNVLLGHILILAPLVATAAICLKFKAVKFKNFTKSIKKVINDSTVEDTINLYEAIRICNPGGLGRIDKYDIHDIDSLTNIKKDNINLKKIFELSKDYDLISSEYSSGFAIILNKGLPFYFKTFNQTNDINIATVNTFLKILSEHPDTLIIRKSGIIDAQNISQKADQIMKQGGISTQAGLKLIRQLDNILHEKSGKLNPGTTADIIAGVIFCTLLFGLRF